ncbi:MAG: hypothetical protein NTW00_00395 [Hyphomicrobiales bacterium]|nr:hypothetical protein [Hyphomicrobiales bacterium]
MAANERYRQQVARLVRALLAVAEQPLDPLALEPFLPFAFPAFGFEAGLATLLDLPGAVLERTFMGGH